MTVDVITMIIADYQIRVTDRGPIVCGWFGGTRIQQAIQ